MIRALRIQLRRIVCAHENAHQTAIGNFRRIVGDLHALRVASIAFTNGLIIRARRVTVGVAGHYILHAVDVIEHTFRAPEATAREHGLCFARFLCKRRIVLRQRQARDDFRFRRRWFRSPGVGRGLVRISPGIRGVVKFD